MRVGFDDGGGRTGARNTGSLGKMGKTGSEFSALSPKKGVWSRQYLGLGSARTMLDF